MGLRSQCPTRPPRICQKNPSQSQSHGTHGALTLRTQIENIGFNHMVVFCLLSDEVTIICFYKRNEDFLKKKVPITSVHFVQASELCSLFCETGLALMFPEKKQSVQIQLNEIYLLDCKLNQLKCCCQHLVQL